MTKNTVSLAESVKGEKVLKIVFEFDTELLNKVREIPGRLWHPSDKCWSAPLHEGTITQLRFWGFSIDKKLQDHLLDTNKTTIDITTNGIPGLKGTLRPFQTLAVAFAEKNDGRILNSDEQGLGKTIETLAWIQLHRDRTPVIIVCPASLKLNWEREIKTWLSDPKVQVLSGTTPYKTKGEILIINYDIVFAWYEELKKLKPQIIVLDECFPAGTKINTPKGNINIEELKVGDSVYNATGIGQIEKVIKQTTTELVRLHLTNGDFIDTTPNHPFFTEDGWVVAEKLINKKLFACDDIFNIFAYNIKSKQDGKEKMCMVWKNLFNRKENTTILQSFLCFKIWEQFKTSFKNKSDKSMLDMPQRISSQRQKSEILWDILLSEMENATTRNTKSCIYTGSIKKSKYCSKRELQKESTESKGYIIENAKEQSNNQSRNSRKNQSLLGRIWTSFKSKSFKRGEWETFTKTTKNTLGCIGSSMENRICNSNKTQSKRWFRLSNLLQSRCGFTRTQNLDRNRWLVPQSSKQNTTGQKERGIVDDIGVERIEILKRSCGTSSESHTVYNLQVSGHPSYYAEGFLVHNCHSVKSSATRRTKAVKKLCKEVPHIIALSGTPIVNRPIEIYNTLQILDKNLFPNYLAFTRRYCNAHNNGFGIDVNGASHTDELHATLTGTVMLRRKKIDVLKELPDKIYSFVPLALDNTEEYREAEKDFIAYVRREKGIEAAQRIESVEALAKIEGLKQLAVKGKLKEAIEWIKNFLESDQKLVVFCTHKFVIDALMSQFQGAVKIDGSVNMHDRQRSVDIFQHNPKCKLFVGNVQAAGVGLTLTASSNVAFLELAWSPSLHSQAEDRCHRIGQKDSVNVHFLLAQNTIEEKIAKMIDAKRKIVDSVLDGKETEQGNLLSEIMQSYL